jgi:hypothetical protein
MRAQSARFFVPFFVWLCLGSLGLVALALSQDINALRELGIFPDVFDHVLRALIVVQPFILLVAGVGTGVSFGERVGLRSWVTARLRGDPPPLMQVAGLALAALVGFGTGAVVVMLDRLFAPWIGLPSVASLPDIGTAIMAISYGGITEELTLRYGLMTFLVWVGAKVWTTLPPALYLGVVLLSAVLFGAGHLPAMAALIASDSDCDFAHCRAQCTARVGFWLAVLAAWPRTRDGCPYCHAPCILDCCRRAVGPPPPAR